MLKTSNEVDIAGILAKRGCGKACDQRVLGRVCENGPWMGLDHTGRGLSGERGKLFEVEERCERVFLPETSRKVGVAGILVNR